MIRIQQENKNNKKVKRTHRERRNSRLPKEEAVGGGNKNSVKRNGYFQKTRIFTSCVKTTDVPFPTPANFPSRSAGARRRLGGARPPRPAPPRGTRRGPRAPRHLQGRSPGRAPASHGPAAGLGPARRPGTRGRSRAAGRGGHVTAPDARGSVAPPAVISAYGSGA